MENPTKHESDTLYLTKKPSKPHNPVNSDVFAKHLRDSKRFCDAYDDRRNDWSFTEFLSTNQMQDLYLDFPNSDLQPYTVNCPRFEDMIAQTSEFAPIALHFLEKAFGFKEDGSVDVFVGMMRPVSAALSGRSGRVKKRRREDAVSSKRRKR